jgi:hypothetical protein
MGDDVVPRRADPFDEAFATVNSGTRYFGAKRDNGDRHQGIDLFVDKNTPVQVPADGAILIGVTRHKGSEAGKTMGNALVFFVPDPERPYFLAFLHLSPRTFRLLKESDIGTEFALRAGEGRIVAYTGDSATERAGAHLHVTAATTFMYGGTTYTAEDFLKRYQERTLGDFLKGRNFHSIVPPEALTNKGSMKDYLNPMDLVRDGRLRISSLPIPQQLVRERAGDERFALR